MKNNSYNAYNNSDIGYCDPEWDEMELTIPNEIAQELKLLNDQEKEELVEQDEQQG